MNAPATMTLQQLRAGAPAPAEFHAPAVFNPDAWHAMQVRDEQLIEDSILHGAARTEYVYEFSILNTKVRGVSVVGARELASQYGGIKSRIVASVDKTGDLFVFKSFEPLAIQANIISQLADQEDFYEVVVEIQDLKTGNSVQVRKKETKREFKRDGTPYDRPHYDVIAESKAFRNGVLSILPQGVIKAFMERCLKAGNASQEKTIDQLREGVLAFAAKHSIGIDRRSIEQMTYAQILGLGNAAKDGGDAFKGAAQALGVVSGQRPSEHSGSGRIDTDSGEIKGGAGDERTPPVAAVEQERAGDPRKVEGERTGDVSADARRAFEDACKLVKAGRYDDARALCPGPQQASLEQMIANREAGNAAPAQEQQPQQRTAARGRRNVGGVE